jgi:hypothetical protein
VPVQGDAVLAAEVEGHPGHALHLVDGPSQRLHAAHPHGAVPHGEDVADADATCRERAGDHRPGTLDVERAVDPEPDVRRGVRQGQRSEHRDQPLAKLVEP